MTRILIPWRATPSRLAPLDQVRAWHEGHGHEVVLVDSGAEIFNLAASRNLAMAGAAPGEVVVLSDADTLPELEALQEALAAAATSGRVHLPYTEYWRTDGLFRAACSGVFVTTPEAYFAAGGMDERFTSWGPEDFAFKVAHETLLGQQPRHAGRVTALTHEPAPVVDFIKMQRHYENYLRCRGDARGMRRLVDGNRL